jgi:hypothetical protein
MGTVVTLQHDGTQGRRGGREGGAPVFITVKRLDNKAQGRLEGGAPWVQRQEVPGTPTGSDNMDGQIARTMSCMSGVHTAGCMFNPVGPLGALEKGPPKAGEGELISAIANDTSPSHR